MPLPTWMTTPRTERVHPAVAIKDVIATRRPVDEGASALIPPEINSIYLGTMYIKQDEVSHPHQDTEEVRIMANLTLFLMNEMHWVGVCVTETVYTDPERPCVACTYHDSCSEHAIPFEPRRPAFDDYGQQDLRVPETTMRNTVFVEARVFFGVSATKMWSDLQMERHGWFVPDLYRVLDNGEHPFGSYAMARRQHPSGPEHEVWHLGEWTLPTWSFNYDAIEAALASRGRGAPDPVTDEAAVAAFLNKHCPRFTIVPRIQRRSDTPQDGQEIFLDEGLLALCE
ncbi:hypothetical protein HBH98_182730 [Parastagonospora nodorum]|nr:hypothetical protein HBH53_231000 [Parastagonospora nodorum]KAH3956684.1 hypothetical protein HBH51_237390 [Parastagonospora nodorum]KAH4215661.1 hypothetical protein HBI06_244160 [Parastagonospora nodorum]KAH4224457.1 hypothetical protein HBI05_236420 [Parastagonospora nodorum]KAH4341267.1 hypothetical protein HBH98_182730 [Parastagonospora nodorum]